jgi:hypothetical protein
MIRTSVRARRLVSRVARAGRCAALLLGSAEEVWREGDWCGSRSTYRIRQLLARCGRILVW